MFSIFQNIFRKNHDEARIKEGLMKAQERYYMPYTKKMLDSGIPLVSNKNLHKDIPAALSRNSITGEATEVFYNPGYSIGDYSFYNIMEHEALHFNQRPLSFYSFKLLSSLKDAQIIEFEAYAQNTYMFLHDYAAGLLTKGETRRLFERYPLINNKFLQAYTQKEIKYEDTLTAFKAFKGNPLEKSEEECFGDFFYRLSFSEEARDIFKTLSFNNIHYLLSDYKTEGGISFFKQQIGKRRLFERNYTFEDAKNELHRNGNKYLDVLNEKQKKEFWENICTLTPQEQAEMASLNRRAKEFVKAYT